MFRTIAATSLLALACAMPAQQAAAQDALGGAIFGGAAGALLGGALGGRGGAIAGGLIGGTMGAAIAADGQRRRNGYYWYQNGCYIQRPDGAWVGVHPQYCADGPAVAPAPVAGPMVEDDEVEYVQPRRAATPDQIAACARRFRSYDPNSMTFLASDGTRRPCPSY
jgi:BA14K-like protein